jgi:hypothetical protein
MANSEPKLCIDCKHCMKVMNVTGYGEPSYQCNGVVSPIHGGRLKLDCKNARLGFDGECGKEGKLWEKK